MRKLTGELEEVPVMQPRFVVENDLPLPGPRIKYPYAEMKVGEYFEAPAELRNSISVTSNRFSKRNKGVKFSIRGFVDVDGKRFVRCFRIK